MSSVHEELMPAGIEHVTSSSFFFYPSLTPNILLFFPLLPNRVDCVLPRADPLSGGRRWRAFHPRAPQRRHQPGAHGGLLHSAGYEQGFAHLKQPPHPQTSLLSCLLLPVVTLNMTGVSALFSTPNHIPQY